MQTNTYDPASGTVTLSLDRARAVREVAAHYQSLLSDDPTTRALREAYAIPDGAVPDAGRRADISAFYFWTAWACATHRPGDTISYTNDWPAEPLLDHGPTSSSVLWSIISVVVLIPLMVPGVFLAIADYFTFLELAARTIGGRCASMLTFHDGATLEGLSDMDFEPAPGARRMR